MIASILAEASSESGKVCSDSSLSLARTVICATVALTTVPSNFGWGSLCGFSTLTTMGAAVSTAASTTGAGTWALADVAEPGAGGDRGNQCGANQYGFSQKLHSESSVEIRSDFRKRMSCGVMASLATAFLSGSASLKESWST